MQTVFHRQTSTKASVLTAQQTIEEEEEKQGIELYVDETHP